LMQQHRPKLGCCVLQKDLELDTQRDPRATSLRCKL